MGREPWCVVSRRRDHGDTGLHWRRARHDPGFGSETRLRRGRGTFPALGGNVQHVGEELGLANALDSALLL